MDRRMLAQVRDKVSLDWHGHNDRGLSVINTLAAIDAGYRVHGTISIGGVGNTSLDGPSST